MSINSFTKHVEKYAAGKQWYWYLPLWLLGLYVCFATFQIDMVNDSMPFILLIPQSFDFVLHEWAHIFTALLPPVLTASAGSLSELALGTTLVVMAFWQRSYFASMFSLLWFDLACQSAGTYMADAVPQRLQLVSLGGALTGQEPIHDWHFVFGQLNLLGLSGFIGDSIRVIGYTAGVCGVIFAAWLLYKMSQAPAWAPNEEEALLMSATKPSDGTRVKSESDDGYTSLPLSDNDVRNTRSPKNDNGKRA